MIDQHNEKQTTGCETGELLQELAEPTRQTLLDGLGSTPPVEGITPRCKEKLFKD